MGFNLQDKNYKSTKNLIKYLVRAAGYNSNFLLNVGPMPDGKIQPEFLNTLKEIGNGQKNTEKQSMEQEVDPFHRDHGA